MWYNVSRVEKENNWEHITIMSIQSKNYFIYLVENVNNGGAMRQKTGLDSALSIK
jgi:hypothetical protein